MEINNNEFVLVPSKLWQEVVDHLDAEGTWLNGGGELLAKIREHFDRDAV